MWYNYKVEFVHTSGYVDRFDLSQVIKHSSLELYVVNLL